MKKTCYVTTPIYYSSGNVHIGNSYTTIACDVYSRFHRLSGYDTFFLTGMDEHGQKNEEAAAAAGKTPQQLVDEIAATTNQLWRDMKITHDDFIRTSEERHTRIVREIFSRLLAQDDIYMGAYEGDYCVSCEAFFTKSQLGEDGSCPDCGKPTRKVKEECYFLRLSKYQDRLLEHIKANPDFIEPETRRNEVIAFVESGLEDLAVSRTSFRWGIPVRENPRHVVYVWIDALSNYLTALGYLSADDALYQKYWVNGDKVVHVIGKDILRFHAVYWPIMLMALGVPVNFKLYVHGWVLMKEGKMSKSAGNIIYPRDVMDKYGLDAMRLYLIKEMPLGNDCVFSYERFIEKYNSDLANDLGNLLNRTLVMINKYFAGRLEKPDRRYGDYDRELEETIENTARKYKESFASFRFQNGLNEVWHLINRSNKYIDETTPWVVAKDESRRDELNAILYHLYESLRVTAIMLAPVIPDTAEKIFRDFGLDTIDFNGLGYGKTASVKVTEKPEILFRRLDPEIELKSQNENTKPEITIDDFNKLDLRVGEVIDARKVENSDKLLLLKIKIGAATRQVVSGLAGAYAPADLIGKKLVVVANLKPVKIRGYLSEGMVLTAEGKGLPLEVLEVKKHNSNSRIS
jgi:methionyl-tRNA synthetase